MGSKLRTASWILLTLLGTLTLLGSLASVTVAYFADAENDVIGAGMTTLAELTADRQDVQVALRARRGTAAAYGVGYAVLFLILVLIPYRRGEVWAWWAILVGTLLSAGIILLRVPTLDTNLGLVAATAPLGVVVLALVMDAGRLRS